MHALAQLSPFRGTASSAQSRSADPHSRLRHAGGEDNHGFLESIVRILGTGGPHERVRVGHSQTQRIDAEVDETVMTTSNADDFGDFVRPLGDPLPNDVPGRNQCCALLRLAH